MPSSKLNWQPLDALKEQLELNCAAVEARYPKIAATLRAFAPASECYVAADEHNVYFATRDGDAMKLIPCSLDVSGAAQIAAKLFPTGECTEPVLVAGLSQGWLWQKLFELPVKTSHAPGFRPPLYFLTNEIDRLWMAMHIHDWQKLFADHRVRLFVGADAIGDATRELQSRLDRPLPRLSVTVNAASWGDHGTNINTITQTVLQTAGTRLNKAMLNFTTDDQGELRERFSDRRALRVLGITSLYTTFLQYSMRDWLEGFESLGHTTRLVIEEDDSSQMNAVLFAETCAEFKPDLIVMIDHYRGEFSGLPTNVPFVMWVQDQLPNIFRAQAGAAQREFDYTIGYGRLECTREHAYPASRFLPAMIGTNPRRFQPARLSETDLARFGCDVSYVSHASTSAEVLLREEVEKSKTPESKKLLETVFERVRAFYERGASLAMPHEFRAIIDAAFRDLRLSTDDINPLINLFTHRINNALFRHQSIEWLTEIDVRINLFGRGWETHPRFSKFARGCAENDSQLSTVFQASKINLQISPFGASHQRVFDGLAAGGFFLMRSCPGDQLDQLYRELWNRCDVVGVRSTPELLSAADQNIQQILIQIRHLASDSAKEMAGDIYAEIAVLARSEFCRTAGTLWNEYPRVAFSSRDELHRFVTHFLKDDADRACAARSMRERVLKWATYQSTARQTVDFIAADLNQGRGEVENTHCLAA